MAKEAEETSLISPGQMQPRSSSAGKIFLEAARLVGSNWKSLLSIFLILLLPFTLLLLGNYLIINHLVRDMVKRFLMMLGKDPMSTEYSELLAAAVGDLREVTLTEVITIFFGVLLNALLVFATVHTVAMASRGVKMSSRDLFSEFRRGWKGPAATYLYVVLLSIGYWFVWLILITVSVFVFHGSAAVYWVIAVIEIILALLLLAYLRLVWIEGLIASVVEEDVGGLAALGRASELIRGSRKVGYLVSFLLMLIMIVWITVFELVYHYVYLHGNVALSSVVLMFYLYVCLVLDMFVLAVFVVFYDECKRNHGEEAAFGERLAYARVTAAALTTVDDEALP